MIDLNRTWCEATEENYNALVELGLKKLKFFNSSESIKVDWGYIVVLNGYEIGGATKDWIEENSIKQIHLVNGQFEYVEKDIAKELEKAKEEDEKLYPDLEGIETAKQCQFARYGFEKPKNPDLKINYLFKDKYEVLRGHEINKNTEIIWNKKGKCLTHTDSDLTPLKKEWWEDESNFPCLAYNEIMDVFLVAKEKDMKIYKELPHIRLATKEEVLSLYKEAK